MQLELGLVANVFNPNTSEKGRGAEGHWGREEERQSWREGEAGRSL